MLTDKREKHSESFEIDRVVLVVDKMCELVRVEEHDSVEYVEESIFV